MLDLIHSANGVAVMAHPVMFNNTELLLELIEAGKLDGIEAYHHSATPTQQQKLVDIAMNRKVDDNCRTFILEVLVEDTEAETHKAWMEEVIVKPKSSGGKANVSIPYTVNYAGNRVEGTVTIKNKVPTFTAKTALPA